jgi:outer membrane protein assembly factor BamD
MITPSRSNRPARFPGHSSWQQGRALRTLPDLAHYYEQIEDVNRDQSITSRRWTRWRGDPPLSDTRYASDSRLKVDLVRDHLAGKEMEVGRLLPRRAQWLARVALPQRGRRISDTTHTPEALMPG